MSNAPGFRTAQAFTLEIDQKEVERLAQTALTHVLTAARLSIRGQTKALERDLEQATQAAVPGRLYKAWGSASYPKANVNSYSPAGEIFANGGARTKGAITYWTQAGVNKAKSGQYLAVPTKFAGQRPRSGTMTPGEWERRNGIRLHFVYRGGGKPSLLMARRVIFGANGVGVRAVTVKRIKGKRYANADFSPAKTQDVPIFVLIPLQRFANKFSIAPIIARRERMLVEDFEGRMVRVANMNLAGRS